jgi:hypothetical protein
MRIHIRTLSGHDTTLSVLETDTVLTVKQKIADAEGYVIALQRLIFRGRILADEGTLSDIGVQNESVVHLVWRSWQAGPPAPQAVARPAPAPMNNVPFSVTVTMDGYLSATVQALATTTILGLKELIAQSALGVPVAEQRLETPGGAGVNWPGRSLRACRIRHGAQLILRRV